VRKVQQNGKYPAGSLPAGAYDAVIVGGGPSGSTMGFFASKGGAKVCVLDKAKFPRDKYCGDAVCTPAMNVLREMGVMQELDANNEAHHANAGGFVSPSGVEYIGASMEQLGGAAACAVKRTNLDKRIAWAGQRAGTDLKENWEVDDAKFDKEKGLWTVTSVDGKQVTARLLVCADGATSPLATKLGYCTEAPRGICSRAFVEGGSHNCNYDGVCFYQRESLPGYSAIFRHPNNELNFCYYLIPTPGVGGADQCGMVKESDLARLHNDAIKNDPYISRSLGPNPKIERMKAASLRLGCQGLSTSHDDHLLIIGDAAGHIDPLTGEGIHTAIQGGKAAAETLLEMRAGGDFSANSTRVYEDRVWNLFVRDFELSTKGAALIYKMPILLDATAAETKRKGDPMMVKWAEIMTGMQNKTYFLRPDIGIPLAIAIVREWVEQTFLGKKDVYYAK
jgi:geranylgeranyl reductase family protein